MSSDDTPLKLTGPYRGPQTPHFPPAERLFSSFVCIRVPGVYFSAPARGGVVNKAPGLLFVVKAGRKAKFAEIGKSEWKKTFANLHPHTDDQTREMRLS